MYEKRRCKECGEWFIPNSSRQQFCKKDHYRPCPICGKPVLVKQFSDVVRTCSTECRKELTRRNNLAKYGVEDPANSPEAIEKRKQTCLMKYGVDNPFKSEEFKEKTKETLKSRYGVEYISQSEENKQKVHDTWSSMSEKQKSEIQEKRISTSLNRYGTENPAQSKVIRDKIKQTLEDTYGVTCSLQIPSAKEKTKQTMIERYGTINPGLSDTISKKRKHTCEVKYGVPYYLQSDEFKSHYQSTMLEKYGVTNPMQYEPFQKKAEQTCLEKYGVKNAMLTEESIHRCRDAMLKNTNSHVSRINQQFKELLDLAGIQSEYEFIVDKYWYDLHILNSNILIEVDPTYTHSTEPNFYRKTELDPMYHRNKSNVANKYGYRCIHIFDWDDWNKIIGLLKLRQKLYARKTTIEYIEDSVADEFLNMYHLQGTVRNQLVCLGLFIGNELYSVMTFGIPRYTKKYQWELLRYATRFEYEIVGGAQKLFKHFIDDIQPESIVSYCDLSKFNGETYVRLGFKHLRDNTPNKIWSKRDKKITDNLLRQLGYDKLFGTNYGKGTNNEQLMIQNGWRSVYDCGQGVYVWNK